MNDCACAQGADAARARAAATPKNFNFMISELPKPARKLAGRERQVNPSKRQNRAAGSGCFRSTLVEPHQVRRRGAAGPRRNTLERLRFERALPLLESHVQALGDIG